MSGVCADKSALVLLHGWGAHSGVWDDMKPYLSADFSVFAPDLPGHGVSTAVMDREVEKVIDRLASEAPQYCAIAGWSLGGQLALRWAYRHPRQVTRLILLASTPRFVDGPDWPQGMAAATFAEFAESLGHDPEGTLRRFRLLTARGDENSRRIVRRLDAAFESSPMPAPKILKQTLEWLKEGDLRRILPAITQPTLLLHGTEDRIVSSAAAEFMSAQLPHARIRLFSGAAHAPFISAPDDVGLQMTEFCRGR